jgi:hypothetical protein
VCGVAFARPGTLRTHQNAVHARGSGR